MVEEYMDAVASMVFWDKLNLLKRTNDSFKWSRLDYAVDSICWNGYLADVPYKRVRENTGEYYVYLWRHCWGDPFYVGMGKGDRWKSKGGRCDEFYGHLDAGDAVVYLLLDGVDNKTAHEYERYVSVSLSCAGYCLANGDNNPRFKSDQEVERTKSRCLETAGKDMTSRVEKAVFDILKHIPSTADYRVTDGFLRKYGSCYFSRNYIKGYKEEGAG